MNMIFFLIAPRPTTFDHFDDSPSRRVSRCSLRQRLILLRTFVPHQSPHFPASVLCPTTIRCATIPRRTPYSGGFRRHIFMQALARACVRGLQLSPRRMATLHAAQSYCMCSVFRMCMPTFLSCSGDCSLPYASISPFEGVQHIYHSRIVCRTNRFGWLLYQAKSLLPSGDDLRFSEIALLLYST